MLSPSWVPAHEHRPAFGRLLLVQCFVNTRDLDLGTDILAEAGAAGGWLREARLLPASAEVTEDELAVTRAVREAIRALLACNGGGPEPTGQDLRPLLDLAGSSQLELSIRPPGELQLDIRCDGTLSDALLGLLLIIRDAQRDGTWPRLKACRNQDCQWIFYDRSHGSRSVWCDMALCGNLVKNRNLRTRRRNILPAAPGGAAGRG